MDPHSTWLGWTAETGLIGLAAWLALFAWLLRPLLRGTWEGRVAGMAMLGLLLNGLHVEVLHLKFVWVFLALAVGAAWQDGGWSGAPALTDG